MRKRLAWGLGVLAFVYLALAVMVTARHAVWCDPAQAADRYLEALRKKDAAGIYLFSHMLGPHLSGMMEKSNLGAEEKKLLWAKDFNRWREEFSKAGGRGHSLDPMRREAALVASASAIEQVSPGDWRSVEYDQDGEYLASFRDVCGSVHHLYYRLAYRDARSAPPVSILENVRTARSRRIKSVVVRLEVTRRPEVGGLRALLIGWCWLDRLRAIVPAGLFARSAEPHEVWAVKLSLAVDKLKLETF
ncbi:MAG: hypothetical protein D6806_17915 [Deltaproteobacteria bacterium]|nr:MAG: hypothetical protein D6806_17915 [Deltaproteobacteria bacterium]